MATASECAADVKFRRAAVRYNGEPGIWLHERIALCVVDWLDEWRLLEKREQMLTKGINLREAEITQLRLSLGEYALALDEMTSAQKMTEQRARDLERNEQKWRRRRWLWPALAFVVGAALTTAIVIGVK